MALSQEADDWALELRQAEIAARKHHEPIRRIVEWYGTKWYRNDIETEPSPDNVIFSWVHYMRSQLSNAPKACVDANWESVHEQIAKFMEAGLLRWGATFPLSANFDLCVRDALFGYGVMSCGIEEFGDVQGQIGGRRQTLRPYLTHIPMDEWGCDPRCEHLKDARFQYRTYEIDLDSLAGMRGADPEAIKSISDSYDPTGSSEADRTGVNKLATGTRKRIRIYDIWQPEMKTIARMAATVKGEPMSTWLMPPQKWWGPTRGPFMVLGFDTVPGDPYPCSPIQPTIQQIIRYNEHLTAETKEAGTIKRFIAVDAANTEAADAIEKVENGQVAKIPNLANGAAQQMEMGGVSKDRMLHTDRLKDRLDKNLAMGDSQQGVSNNDTATANNIANGNAQTLLTAMRGAINEFSREAFTAVGWYLFYDANVSMRVSIDQQQTDPMTGATTMTPVNGEFIGGVEGGWYQGEFLPPMTDISWEDDFSIIVDPESTTYATDQQRQQDAMLLFQVGQTAFTMLTQMPGVNVEFIVDTIGESMNRRGLYSKLIDESLIAMNRMQNPQLTQDAVPPGASPAVAHAMGGGMGQPAAQGMQSPAPLQMGTSPQPAAGGSFGRGRASVAPSPVSAGGTFGA